METRQMTPFFSSAFSVLTVTFLNLKILKIHVHVPPPLVPIEAVHHTFLESRHPEVKNLYYVLFTRRAKFRYF